MDRFQVIARPTADNPNTARALYSGNSQDKALRAFREPDLDEWGPLPRGRWVVTYEARNGGRDRRTVDLTT